MKSPYDVIVKPIITEKTTKLIELENCAYPKYTFEVALINQGNNRQILENLFQEELQKY